MFTTDYLRYLPIDRYIPLCYYISMTNYYRLQHKNISINQMRTFTSDYTSDAGYLDESMFDSAEEYETALAEQHEQYDLTICASSDPYETAWGGAELDDDDEVIVMTGRLVMDIYDGVRLYSPSLNEVARFTLREWKRMQETGEVDQYA